MSLNIKNEETVRLVRELADDYDRYRAREGNGDADAGPHRKDNPEIVRIISGVLTEQRNDGPAKQYGPGSELINNTGVEHMWANLGTETTITLNTAVRLRKPEDVITPVPPVK